MSIKPIWLMTFKFFAHCESAQIESIGANGVMMVIWDAGTELIHNKAFFFPQLVINLVKVVLASSQQHVGWV